MKIIRWTQMYFNTIKRVKDTSYLNDNNILNVCFNND